MRKNMPHANGALRSRHAKSQVKEGGCSAKHPLLHLGKRISGLFAGSSHLSVRCALAAALAATALVTPTETAASNDGLEEGDELICHLHQPLSATRLLRRTSLALLGRVPSIEEYEMVDGMDPDTDEYTQLVEEMLTSDEYRLQMRRYHMQILWSNPDGVRLGDNASTISRVNLAATAEHPQSELVYRFGSGGRRRNYRRNLDGTSSAVPHDCYNVPHATLQVGYQPGDAVDDAACIQVDDGTEIYCAEGWTEIQPYFDDTTTIKVCARDAQDVDTYTQGQNTYSCYQTSARTRKECGCGTGLQSCLLGFPYSQESYIQQTMQDQVLRLTDDYTGGQAPYVEMLTTTRSYMNGTLNHYLRHMASLSGYGRVYNATYDAQADGLIAEGTPFYDDTWVETQRSGLHAGILTMPAYLLRFQTDRGRANRFRIAFMGQYFVPGSGNTDGCVDDGNDLTERCLCRDCHQTLEPMAAYFGGFSEAGASMLTLTDLPAEVVTNQECNALHPFGPPQGSFCNRFYKRVDTGNGFVWRRNPLGLVDVHPEYETNLDNGPAQFVDDEALAPLNGKAYSYLSWSTTRNVFKFLMGRELIVDPLDIDNEQELLDELATEFENGFDFQALVRSIVTLPTFRRMP